MSWQRNRKFVTILCISVYHHTTLPIHSLYSQVLLTTLAARPTK